MGISARLAILCGLPLSGKSTWATRQRNLDPWVIVCPDTIRLALHGNDFYGPAEPFVWAAAELMVRTLLLGEHMVLVDATNTTKKRRKMWLDIARDYHLGLEAFVMTTPAEECFHRAAKEGKLHMKEVIHRMSAQWEPVNEEGIRVIGVPWTLDGCEG